MSIRRQQINMADPLDRLSDVSSNLFDIKRPDDQLPYRCLGGGTLREAMPPAMPIQDRELERLWEEISAGLEISAPPGQSAFL
jgi:hypothetical protein